MELAGVAQPSIVARPPRLPLAGLPFGSKGPVRAIALPRPDDVIDGPATTAAKKRRPPVLGPEEPEAGQPQSFCLSTPRGIAASDDSGRHYIGSPRASSILSAFLDFGDTNSEDEEDEGGPQVDGLLDFDGAMAALEAAAAQGVADSNSQGAGCGALAAVACAEVDECDCSGSTRCGSDHEGSPAAAKSSSSEGGDCCGARREADDDNDEEDEEEGSDYSYDSDFEAESSEEEGGEEDVEAEKVAGGSIATVGSASARRTASRGRSRGARNRSASRPPGLAGSAGSAGTRAASRVGAARRAGSSARARAAVTAAPPLPPRPLSPSLLLTGEIYL
mmetsp:Transcript_609/g.1414  ORF Transcript_609/g.1414 Transcript_609/m.1414 type:complete len:334 (+) Transcript_609:84-1085(+)